MQEHITQISYSPTFTNTSCSAHGHSREETLRCEGSCPEPNPEMLSSCSEPRKWKVILHHLQMLHERAWQYPEGTRCSPINPPTKGAKSSIPKVPSPQEVAPASSPSAASHPALSPPAKSAAKTTGCCIHSHHPAQVLQPLFSAHATAGGSTHQ